MTPTPPINHLAEHGFGGAGAALMAAMAQHRGVQSQAAGYEHPPSHPFAHHVGRPGDEGEPEPRHRRRRPAAAALGPIGGSAMPMGGVPPMGGY